MRLITPLPRSRTATGVVAPDIVGPKAGKAPRAMIVASASNRLPTPVLWSDNYKLTKDGPDGVEEERP